MTNVIKKTLVLLVVFTLASLMLVSCGGKVTKETLEALVFEDKTVEYNGEKQSIYIDNKYEKKGVVIKYENNNKILPGEYTVKAKITFEDIVIEKTAVLTIKGYESVIDVETTQTFYVNTDVELEYTLNNEKQVITILDEKGNPVDVSKYTKPGTYKVVLYAGKAGLYEESERITVTINIIKSLFDVKFNSIDTVYDGTEKKVELEGNLPAGYTVRYENNKATEVGQTFAKAEILDANGKVVETHRAVIDINYPENEDFAAYLDEFFVLNLEDDQLSVNIYCENPADFGLEHYDAEWFTFEAFTDEDLESDKAYFVELLDELYEYKDAELSDYQVIAYNNIESFLQHYIDLFNIKDSTFMNISYVDQFGGHVADFGTYMEAYSLRSELEVQDVVDFIKSTKTAFPSYLDFVQIKLEKGYGLSDYTINEMRGYLEDVLKDKDNYYLVDILKEKINKLTFLTDEQKADYNKQIADEMKNSFMVGVQELYDGLGQFLGKLPEEDEGYWTVYEKGQELYVLSLQNLLGYRDLDMKNYIATVDKALSNAVAKVTNAQNAIVSATGITTWAELDAILAKNSIVTGTPEEMMEYLKEFAKTIVPELKTNPDIVIKEMDEASAKVSNAVAYYVHSALDSTASEYITLNPIKLKDSSDNDVLGTLAHEGYPGHLYEYVYSKELDLPNISKIMTSTAHGEGWATYVELALYQYAKEQKDNNIFDLVMDYMYANQVSAFLLETRIDAGIHYEGWDVAKVSKYLGNMGYNSEAAQGMYNLLIEMPTQYASYGYGKLVVYNLHEEAKKVLGGYYDEVEFNTMLISNGWINLAELENQYNEYMTVKCYECNIEWK